MKYMQYTQRQATLLKGVGKWNTMRLELQQRPGRMTTEAAEIRDNMGVTDKVRGGNWWCTIAAAEMQDNGGIGDG